MVLLNNSTINEGQISTGIAILQKNKKHVTLRNYNLTERAVDYHLFSNTESTNYPGRSYVYVSKTYNANITLEAAIALPLFIIFFMMFTAIINIMYIQLTLQIQLEETASFLAKTGYATRATYLSISDPKESDALNDLTLSALSIATVQSHFMDNQMKNFLNDSLVKNGCKGINFLSTSVDADNGLVDLVITYKVNVPFIPDNIFSVNLSNRCYFRLCIGQELNREQSEAGFYVYYAAYGSVYHTEKYCRYLLNYSNVSSYNELDTSMHQPCALCVTETVDYMKNNNTTVYTTETGYAYHTSLDCRSFTGNIFRIYVTSLPDKEICSQCLKGK